MRKQLLLEGATQKTPDGVAALLAVVERPMVHIHPHKFVREIASHVACILERVLHGGRAMIQTVLDARSQNIGNSFARLWRESLMNHIPA